MWLAFKPGYRLIWNKVFKNGPSRICGRQQRQNLKGYGLLRTGYTPFRFFKGCLRQILLEPFLNTLSHILHLMSLKKHKKKVKLQQEKTKADTTIKIIFHNCLKLMTSNKFCVSSWIEPDIFFSRNPSIVLEACMQSFRKPAIRFELRLRRWMSFITDILRASWSISMLLGLKGKHFINAFIFSCSPLESVWLIVSNVHKRWVLSNDIWELN